MTLTKEQAKKISDGILVFLARNARTRKGYIHTRSERDEDGIETDREEITFDGRFVAEELTEMIASIVL